MPAFLLEAIVGNQAERDLTGIIVGFFVLVCIVFVDSPVVESRTRLGGELLPWHITANTISALADTNVFIGEGDVVVSRGEQTLRADRIVYNKESGLLNAQGNVELLTAGDILRCDKGLFNLKDKTGYILNGSLFLSTNHFYVRGKEIRKTGPETYSIKGCRITSCDGEAPDWSITGSEVDVTIEGYGTVKHAAFFVRHIPLLYFPYIIFPAKTKRQTGVLPPSVGYSRRDGFDIEIPFFWAISDQTDATFYERYIKERGLMQGVEFRYVTGVESKGACLFDILSDKRAQKNLYTEDDLKISPYPRTNQTRYWLRGRFDQQLPYDIGVKLDLDFLSDYDYLREFKEASVGPEYKVRLDEEFGRPLAEAESLYRRSALLITRNFQDYSIHASSTYYEDPRRPEEDTTAQPAADLGFTILPKRIYGLPFFFSLESDYGYIHRDAGQKGQRMTIAPSLSYPIWSIPYIALEPSVKYFLTHQWLEEYQSHKGQQTKETYELGLQLFTIMERVFDLELGSIKRLKHKFQPVLSYTYRPYPDKEAYTPWFEPVDLLGRANVISLSLDNYLDARREDERGSPSFSQSAVFSLTQGYDLDEAKRETMPGEKRKPFTPLRAALSLTPYPALNLSGGASWDHYNHYISSNNVSLDLLVKRGAGKKDRYEIDYGYSRNASKSLSFDVAINLLYGLSVGATGKRDLITKYDIENSYWIDYQSQCWGIGLLYENLEKDKRIMFTFRLLGLGKAGDLGVH
jgi:LPS-assembly protein